MKTLPFLLAAVALLPLSACNTKEKKAAAANAAEAANEAAAANLAAAQPLPPAIRDDKTFRCKDNSLAYVTFYQGDKQVEVRLEPQGERTHLTSDKAGGPYAGVQGWTLSGTDTGGMLTRPGKPAVSCHV